MNMKISGSGTVASGEYENVSISGSGRMQGFIRCNNFSASGSASGERIECADMLKVSGSSSFSEDVKSRKISVSGSFSCGGRIAVDEAISCSGSLKCKQSIKCDTLSVSGGISVAGDIEAETVKISGTLNCGGLVNAENITIKFSRGMEIGSIGGSKIVIYKESNAKNRIRLPLLSSFIKGSGDAVCVKNSIEGDEIAIENVVTPEVTGRIVAIGDGCEIDLVQYSDQVEISPKAKVGKTEKISY